MPLQLCPRRTLLWVPATYMFMHTYIRLHLHQRSHRHIHTTFAPGSQIHTPGSHIRTVFAPIGCTAFAHIRTSSPRLANVNMRYTLLRSPCRNSCTLRQILEQAGAIRQLLADHLVRVFHELAVLPCRCRRLAAARVDALVLAECRRLRILASVRPLA